MSLGLESPKYRHPAIRRASWNPDPDNVAGKAVVRQPRKGEIMTVIMIMIMTSASCVNLEASHLSRLSVSSPRLVIPATPESGWAVVNNTGLKPWALVVIFRCPQTLEEDVSSHEMSPSIKTPSEAYDEVQTFFVNVIRALTTYLHVSVYLHIFLFYRKLELNKNVVTSQKMERSLMWMMK